jgi:hypothetical protein
VAVASWHRGTQSIGPKEIHVGRRAGELRYWYKACQQVFPDLPPWDAIKRVSVHITPELIHMAWDDNDLYVARKRRLR